MPTDPITAREICVKQPNEKIIYTMDFTNRIGTSVTISSIDGITVTDLSGGDSSDVTTDEEQISGKKVLFFIEGGTHAKNYRVEVTITLSNQEILIGGGMLRVLNY